MPLQTGRRARKAAGVRLCPALRGGMAPPGPLLANCVNGYAPNQKTEKMEKGLDLEGAPGSMLEKRRRDHGKCRLWPRPEKEARRRPDAAGDGSPALLGGGGKGKGIGAMTIKEVSEKYGLTPDTLRYYERVGIIPPVPRKKSGVRDYDEAACGWVELMKCMRSAGVRIEALIEYSSLFQQGDETAEARKELLMEQRRQLMERMEDMRRSLDRLNRKIERYERLTGKAES